MVTTLALAQGLREAGVLLAAAALAAVFLLSDQRLRALAVMTTLLLTPLLLASEVLETAQLETVRSHARLLVAAAVVVVAAVWALALVIRRKPFLFPILAVAAIPFRVPVSLGAGVSANLLVPLYLIVAAAGVNYALDLWHGGEQTEPKYSKGRWLELALIGFTALYALQSLYSPDFSKALDQLVFFFLPFALLFKMLLRVRWTAKLTVTCAIIVVALALIFSAIGFWEFATRHLFWNSNAIDANQFAAYFRVNSVFFDPNVFGRYLTVSMLIVVTAILWQINQRWYLPLIAATALLWGGMLVTLSQSSFGALLVGLGVLAALRWKVRQTAIAAGVIAILGLLFAFAFQNALHLHLDKAKSLNVATSGRVGLVGGGIKMFEERPLYGYGSGSFSKVYRSERKTGSQSSATASHNIPITTAAEQGLLGVIAYLVLIACCFVVLFRQTRAPPGGNYDRGFYAARAAVAAAFTAIAFHTMLYAAFLEDPTVWVLLAIGLAFYRQRGFARGA